MSVSPIDFLQSAKTMGSDSEMALRNSISRSYYAAYHRALEIFPADRTFAEEEKTGSHERYIQQLMQADPGSVKRFVAVQLKTLKGRRTVADYRLDDQIRPYESAMQISSVVDFFEQLCAVSEGDGGNIAAHQPKSVEAKKPASCCDGGKQRPSLQVVK